MTQRPRSSPPAPCSATRASARAASSRRPSSRSGPAGRRADEVEAVAADLRRRTRTRLAELGLATDVPAIPSAFSFYDHVLDATAVVGAVPARFADVVGADGCARPRRLLDRGPRPRRRPAARDDQVVRHQLPLPGPGDRPGDDVPLRERPPRARVHGGPRRRRPDAPGHRRPRHVPRAGQGDRGRARRLRADRPPRGPAAGLRRAAARTSPPPAPPGCSSRSPRWSPTRSRSRPSSCSPPSSRRTARWPPT